MRPYIGGVKLAEVDAARVMGWRAFITTDVDPPCPPLQANKAVAVLSAALGRAVAPYGRISHNPCLGLGKLRVAAAMRYKLTPTQVEAIRSKMGSIRDVVLLDLMAYCGLRPGEAFALTWGNVGEATIHINASFSAGVMDSTKTSKARTVRLIQPVLDDPRPASPPAAGGCRRAGGAKRGRDAG